MLTTLLPATAPGLPTTRLPVRGTAAVAPRYRVRLATGAADRRAAQALRFAVFNVELDEGLAESWDTGLDADPFDAVCDHLLVEDAHGEVVGTYRLQTGRTAATSGLGWYSAREFDLAPFEAVRNEVLELGRACVHPQHRSFAVLNLLWKGIGAYAEAHGARHLIGCSSLPTCCPAEGLAAWAQLQSQHAAPPAWRVRPQPGFACRATPAEVAAARPVVPRLISAYLGLGARLCGEPALDRAFRTVDLLTWQDTQAPAFQAYMRRGERR